MRIRILGSAAGGGFPQWNCNCQNCRGLRAGTLRAQARTQSSIAVSGDDPTAWALINASPDILKQLADNSVLQPARVIRDTALAAVVLTDAQIDHTTGLYMLRESTRALPLWCTDSVYDDLTRGNPILSLLAHYCGVEHRRVALDGKAFRIDGVDGMEFTAMPLRSKPPPFSPNRDQPKIGDNIALRMVCTHTGGSALYAPGLGAMNEQLWQQIHMADCVLIDGTFWTDDEMIRLGLSKKTARDIGHLPISGREGMIDWLTRLRAGARRILIHINNTNPILDEDSAERAQLNRLGIEIAFDGMEIEL